MTERPALPSTRPPRLTDGVVLLDGFDAGDARALVEGEDDEIARRLGWFPWRSTLEDAERSVRSWSEDWRGLGAVRAFAVRLPSRVLVGTCDVHQTGEGRAFMSWVTFADYRQRGLATRAGRLVCAWAFEALSIDRMEAYVAPDNHASLGVARNLGFREEGLLRGWALTRTGRSDMRILARLRTDPVTPPD